VACASGVRIAAGLERCVLDLDFLRDQLEFVEGVGDFLLLGQYGAVDRLDVVA